MSLFSSGRVFAEVCRPIAQGLVPGQAPMGMEPIEPWGPAGPMCEATRYKQFPGRDPQVSPENIREVEHPRTEFLNEHFLNDSKTVYIYIYISEVGGSEIAFRQAPP